MSHLFRGGYYGTTTVGERGQIVIPVQARKELGLGIGEKVMVFGRPHKTGLMLIKADDVTRMVSETLAELSGLGEILRSAGVGEEEVEPPRRRSKPRTGAKAKAKAKATAAPETESRES